MEQHAGDFSVTVRDVRQLTQPESDLLTLLWVLEGSVNLAVAEGASQPLAADGLAIVNRNRRWSLRSAGANAVMILTLSASWLARLDNAFFAVDYQITPRTRDADDGLRRLMRQLLVSGLVNHPGHYRLEANRWLSEIALLLATRFGHHAAELVLQQAFGRMVTFQHGAIGSVEMSDVANVQRTVPLDHELIVTARIPARDAAATWSRMSASNGDTMTVGPSPPSRSSAVATK